MGIVLSHGDGIRIEVEAHPIARLACGMVIDHIDGIVVVDQRLHTLSAHQRRSGAGTEVASVSAGRGPGREIT